MQDRFSEAVREMEQRSAFACESCGQGEIDFSKPGDGPRGGHRYDVGAALEQIRHDPSPAGP